MRESHNGRAFAHVAVPLLASLAVLATRALVTPHDHFRGVMHLLVLRTHTQTDRHTTGCYALVLRSIRAKSSEQSQNMGTLESKDARFRVSGLGIVSK